MKRSPLFLVLLGLVLLFASACASTPDAQKSDPTTPASSDSAPGQDSASTAIDLPLQAGARVSYLDWGSGGRLLIGYEDGSRATLEVLRRRVSFVESADGAFPIVAASPDGKLAVIHTTPPALISANGRLILNLNTVQNLESARFSRDGDTLYVAESGGRLRVWGQAHSFADTDVERLEEYLNRQAADFSVEFTPIRGPIFSTNDGTIVFGNEEGIVSIWNPMRPSNSQRIMRMSGQLVSIAATGNHIVATSNDGALKVGKMDPPGYAQWSENARGRFVATNQRFSGRFLLVDEKRLASMRADSGEVEWELEHRGQPCGVSISEDGLLGAVCLDHTIYVFYARDGRAESYFARGEALQWLDADRNSINF